MTYVTSWASHVSEVGQVYKWDTILLFLLSPSTYIHICGIHVTNYRSTHGPFLHDIT
jgi:hypothetical protein